MNPKLSISLILLLFISITCVGQESTVQQSRSLVKPYFNNKLFIDTEIVISMWSTSATDTTFSKNRKFTINKEGKKVYSDTSKIYSDSTDAIWLSKILYRENEKPLPSDSAQIFYRFAWIRSLDEPAIIDIFKKSGKFYIEVKWLLSHQIKTKILPYNKLLEFKKLLTKSGFWKMKPAVAYIMSTDGSNWLIEAQERKKYHFVYRRNPSKEDKDGYFNLGKWMIVNAGVVFKKSHELY